MRNYILSLDSMMDKTHLKEAIAWSLLPRSWPWLSRLSRAGHTRSLSPLMLFISLFVCVLWVTILLGNILAILIAKYWFQPRFLNYLPFDSDKEDVPGVTILKPMKGVDRFLEENLRRYFVLDYPKYEIVFNVADANDPACEIAQRLIQRFPHVQASLHIGADPSVVNPKISNMVYGYEHARYPLVWISDSNAIVSTKSLTGLVRELQRPNVGLAHHLPRGMSSQNFAAELETVYYGTTHARMYLLAHALNINCVVGKSMIFRKSDLDKVGGLRHFGQYLAEDYFISLAMKNTLKLQHALAHDTCAQPMGETTFIDFALRRIRWTRLRKNMIPRTTMIEPVSESITNGCVASIGAYLLLSVHPVNFIIFHMCCWFLCDLALIQSVHRQPIKEVKNFVIPWLVREITYFPLYVYSQLGNTVGWRGNYFYLKRGGYVTRQQQEDSIFNRIFSFERIERYLKSPKVTAALSSLILVIKIVAEVIYRSHRNGQEEEYKVETEDKKRENFVKVVDDNSVLANEIESHFETGKKGKEIDNRYNQTQKETDDHDATLKGNTSDDTRNHSTLINSKVQSMNEHEMSLKNLMLRKRKEKNETCNDHTSGGDINVDESSHLPQHGRSQSVDGHQRGKLKHQTSVSTEDTSAFNGIEQRHHRSTNSIDANNAGRNRKYRRHSNNSFTTAWAMVQLGWSMHWQNERNAREQERLGQI